MILTTLLLIVALIWKFYPPKEINSLYGYRTTKSMKNKETWKFANMYASMWLVRLTALLFMIAILLYSWPVDTALIELYMIAPVIIALIVVIVRTENYLGKMFDHNGNRKKS